MQRKREQERDLHLENTVVLLADKGLEGGKCHVVVQFIGSDGNLGRSAHCFLDRFAEGLCLVVTNR